MFRRLPWLSLRELLPPPIQRFLAVEAGSGALLFGAAAAALLWINSPWALTYTRLWHTSFGAGLFRHTLLFWVNDGLMTFFFLVVGLEIHRELEEGSLANPRVALLPVAAALGGVFVPALIYLLLNSEPVARKGWAIPTATDIAFAAAVLSLLGRHVPPALRMLLLMLAIVDDIAGILIIAFFYSHGIGVQGLLIAATGVLAVLLLQRWPVRNMAAYALPGAVIWYGMLDAGVHPALTGVILGLLTPVSRLGVERVSPCLRVQTALHPWVAYLIMPLFAVANAGVPLGLLSLSGGMARGVALGIVGGLVVGKPTGIILATLLAVRSRLGVLPDGIRPHHIGLLGCLGGVGFTIALFIANLAFTDQTLLETSKAAVLVGSALAAMISLAAGGLARGAQA